MKEMKPISSSEIKYPKAKIIPQNSYKSTSTNTQFLKNYVFPCLSETDELNFCFGYRNCFYLCSHGAQFLYVFEEQSSRLLFIPDESKTDKEGGCKQQQQQPESTTDTDLFLRWGNKKRLRCVRVRDTDDTPDPSVAVSGRRRIRRKINSQFVSFSSDNDHREPSLQPPSTSLTRNSEEATTLRSESNRKSPSDKDDKYTTRGCATAGVVEKPKVSSLDGGARGGVNEVDESSSKSKHVWPKLYIALTSKEKEGDFMAMKGCKLPHRPKKRAKMIQRTLLLMSPGAWLTDMCEERYEVREKKSTKKKPTGLKAMGSMESDSE